MRVLVSRSLLRPLAVALLLALATLLAAPAHAQWKWRDKSGQVNVSDRPPPRDVPDKDILARPIPPDARKAVAAVTGGAPASAPVVSAPPLPDKPAVDRELEARKRAADQEASAKAKADEARLADKRADNCRRARSHLASLDSGQRIARVNDKGEREILDDRARAEEARQAREVIASDCR
jgi:type IV secretory pathway VirB10-like protein